MYKVIKMENIKIITREIIRICLSKGIHVTEECAEFVVKLLLSGPERDLASEVQIEEDDIKHLVKLCVDKLSEKESPSLMTIKMQVYFSTNYASRDEIISKNHAEIKVQAYPLIKEIIETETADTKEDMERLYRKLVIATILGSGMGYPTNTSVLKETTAALQSVFPLAELNQFLSFSRQDRERQVRELTQVVTGIRLFNRDCHRGGEGIDDIPNFLQQAVTAAQDNLEASLKQLMHHVNVLTAAVDAGWRCLVVPGSSLWPDDITWTDVAHFRDLLLLARQQELYLRKLLVDVESSQSNIESLLTRLQKTLLHIHDSVRFRTAVPTIEVYPQFVKLSDVWSSLQDEVLVLNNINGVMWNLHSFTELLEHMDIVLLEKMLGDGPVLTDEERLQVTMGATIDHTSMACEVVHPTTFSDFDRISLQYQGFCPWVLAKGHGALMPANQNIGVVCWQGKYYAFSSPEAAYEFDKNPKHYVTTIAELTRLVPELVNFLQSDTQQSSLKTDETLKSKPLDTIKIDFGVQTELHPIPSNIDQNYSWNVWDLRRRAVQLANICSSLTRSTQTHMSRSRKNIGTQARPSKETASQTRRDSYTYMTPPSNYIFGLRGRRDNIQHVISVAPVLQQ